MVVALTKAAADLSRIHLPICFNQAPRVCAFFFQRQPSRPSAPTTPVALQHAVNSH
jgi:hypothetical protein